MTAESKNLIDLNCILFSVEVAISLSDGQTKVIPGECETVFGKNTLHTLFSHVDLYVNSRLIPQRNNCY